MQEHEIDNQLPPTAQVETLRARLRELRPALAEARRIERRLSSLGAWTDEVATNWRRRKRYSPELRVLQVLRTLERRPGLRRTAIADAIGLTRGRAGQIVELAISRGDVADEGTDGLVLTEQGKRRAQGAHPEQPELIIGHRPVSASERAGGGEDGEDE